MDGASSLQVGDVTSASGGGEGHVKVTPCKVLSLLCSQFPPSLAFSSWLSGFWCKISYRELLPILWNKGFSPGF